MAITINSRPATTSFNEVGNCIKWNLTMSDTGSGDIRRRFGYQLKTKDGKAITNKESLTPVAGSPFDLDFRRDILPFVYTKPPVNNANFFAPRPENEMVVEVQLEFWEIVHDALTCETTEEAVTTDGTYIVVNCASNWFFPIEKSPPALMSRKPLFIQASPKMEDLLYYYKYPGLGHGPTQLQATIYGAGGTVIGDRGPVPIADGMNSYPVGPGNFYNTSLGYPDGAPSGVTAIKIFTDAGDVVTYTIEPCSSENDTTLYFQSTDGGYSGISFENAKRSIKSSFTEICRFNPSCEPWQLSDIVNGGESISNKKSYQEISLTKYIEDEDPRDLHHYEQLLASGSYYLMLPWRYTAVDGRLRMLKFIPSAGSLVYYDQDRIAKLTIKGKVNVPFNLPNFAT